VAGFQTGAGELVVHKSPLWDNAAVWLLLLGLLTAEWALRRLWGLA
jgi:hypothetical protein